MPGHRRELASIPVEKMHLPGTKVTGPLKSGGKDSESLTTKGFFE